MFGHLQYLILVLVLTLSKTNGDFFKDGGCYEVDSDGGYDEPNGTIYSTNNNTVEGCKSYCAKENHGFAFLQNGSSCFCANKVLSVEKLRPPEYCNITCSGDSVNHCGGINNVNVFNTVEESGCYNEADMKAIDTIKTVKQLTLYEENNTISNCLDGCSEKNFAYAGVGFGMYCYCFDELPPPSSLRPYNLCNTPCSGDENQICGSWTEVNVYTTSITTPEACYQNNPTYPLLNDNDDFNVIFNNSESICQGICFKGGHKYAGISGKLCYCGDNPPSVGALRPSSQCNQPCADGKQVCIGRTTVRIVNTLVIGGCYQYDEKLNQIEIKDNTVNKCIKTCKYGKKYFYAGVKNTSCICTTKLSNTTELMPYETCNQTCPGNSKEKCGAPKVMNIYPAQIQVCKTIDGIRKGVPCDFPFEYNGKEYHSCVNKTIEDDRPWCKVKEQYDRKEIGRDWGYCDISICPVEQIETLCNYKCVIISSILSSIVVIAIVVIILKRYYARKLKQEMKVKIKEMLEGNPSKFDKLIPMKEQTNILNYNTTQFEVNKDTFKIEHIIGEGQFGSVCVGTFNRNSEVEEIKVAIKQIKNVNDDSQLNVIVGELKILSNLDSHVSLVNLVAACTNQEIFILLEYCTHGDLKNYLNKNRSTFIENIQNIKNDLDNSLCPTSELLLMWSYSIAQGMDYLASKHIMHGDLAARNILLGDHLLAKISDFGLSKNIHPEEEYTKVKRRMIPWAWMALEYLETGKLTLMSDIWSFGIVLWEIYTLGKKPYEIQAFQEVKKNLEVGYRLPEPDYMSQLDQNGVIYKDIMVPCWQEKPKQRPTFKELIHLLEGKMKVESLEEYQKLDQVYKETNPKTVTNIHET